VDCCYYVLIKTASCRVFTVTKIFSIQTMQQSLLSLNTEPFTMSQIELPVYGKNKQEGDGHALSSKWMGRDPVKPIIMHLLCILYGCLHLQMTDCNTYQICSCFCSRKTFQKSVLSSDLHYSFEMVKYTLQYWDFLYETYMENKSHTFHNRRFCHR
jgi:hypothetical protein